jgi:hypothetical protein
MRAYFLLFVSILLFSCEKKEIPVQPRNPGDAITNQVNMGSEYSEQIYFNLKENKVISQNLKTIWDLSFESKEVGWHILINSSKGMKVAFYEDASLEDELIIASADWKYDASTGNLDSTAVGDWRTTTGVYVIDRGYDHLGNFQGLEKMVIEEVNSDYYTIRFSDLTGDSIRNFNVIKNKDLNFTHFSFDNEMVIVEPEKYSWDILFTQYTYVFNEDGEVIPYQVTGVLLNPNSVMAAMEEDIPFQEIDLAYALNMQLNANTDAIGYDWKYYKLEEGYYIVYQYQNYIIRDIEGVYYKLHFTDFYTDSGIKGAPKFEFQEL